MFLLKTEKKKFFFFEATFEQLFEKLHAGHSGNLEQPYRRGFPRYTKMICGFSKTELDPKIIWPYLRFKKSNLRESSLQAWPWLPLRIFFPRVLLPESSAFCPRNENLLSLNEPCGPLTKMLICNLRWTSVLSEGRMERKQLAPVLDMSHFHDWWQA